MSHTPDSAFSKSAASHFAGGVAYACAKPRDRKKALELAPEKWRVLLVLGMHNEAIKAITLKDVIKYNFANSYLIFNA